MKRLLLPLLLGPLLLGSVTLAQTAPQTIPAQPGSTPPNSTPPSSPPPAPMPPAPAPLQPLGSGPWTATALQTATYLLLPPALDGDTGRLNPDEQKLVLDTLSGAMAAALGVRYPGAHIVTDPATPGVITLRAVLTVPQNLNVFSTVQTRLELSQGQGAGAQAQDTVSALQLAAHRSDAGSFVLNRLMGKLP